MRSYRGGILLTGGEISALVAFSGTDPTQEKLWGCVLKTTTLSIVASASNGVAGLLGVDTGRHDLPVGNWFVKLPDLQRAKKLTTGGGMASFLIGPTGGMRSFMVCMEDKQTSRIVEGGIWTFVDPADQMTLFPLDTLETAARLPDGGVRSQAFSGRLLALYKDLTDASGNDTVEPHYPASALDPQVVRSTAPGDGGTEWRAVFMPRRTDEDGAPVREPEDVSGYRLEPVESPRARPPASVAAAAPTRTVADDDGPPDEGDEPITDASDLTSEEAVAQREDAESHWEPDDQNQAAPQPMARRKPSRASKVPERAKPKAKGAGRGRKT